MLVHNGEQGCVAIALCHRQLWKVEDIEPVNNTEGQDVNLSPAGLLCLVNRIYFIIGLGSYIHHSCHGREAWKLVPYIARIISTHVSTDANFKHSGIIDPITFAEKLQWIGTPKMLLPFVNAVNFRASVSLALPFHKTYSQFR